MDLKYLTTSDLDDLGSLVDYEEERLDFLRTVFMNPFINIEAQTYITVSVTKPYFVSMVDISLNPCIRIYYLKGHKVKSVLLPEDSDLFEIMKSKNDRKIRNIIERHVLLAK